MFRKKGDQSWHSLSEVAGKNGIKEDPKTRLSEYANTATLMEMVTCGKSFTSNFQPHYISPPMEFWFNGNNPDGASSIFLSCAMLLLSVFYLL